ncbi:FCD domain-containing protein [Amycolatopsis sp. FDAARGOS 1241]|uniref:FCD domain-containing protein n=1 Tax=Amycolatopsis sp. FDAARGOS 1241 TaxID=2778070 RepID=UPI00194F353A|nr:FCD domain-containing protein [Amycolatopsis sp. FDAARGOS 1241]QRP43211.1 FCD domain-containing protein [Amycolatopsis sp. FDAARGOS 1241]
MVGVSADHAVALEVAAPQPGRDVPAEHRGLLDAVLARDGALAADRLAAHLEATHQVLVRVL